MSKTLASYLADRPEEQLREMLSGIKQKRTRLQQEDADLAFEERLVEQALSRKARRTGSGSSASRISRERVFEIVSNGVGPHFKAPDAMAAMRAQGLNLAAESLRQHLRRLVKDGKFGREGEFYVNPTASEQPPIASNGNGQATQTFSDAVETADGEEREIGIHTAPHMG